MHDRPLVCPVQVNDRDTLAKIVEPIEGLGLALKNGERKAVIGGPLVLAVLAPDR